MTDDARIAEVERDKAEQWVLDHSTIPYQGRYVESGQWMTFSLCVECGRPIDDHTPGCYVKELEEKRRD